MSFLQVVCLYLAIQTILIASVIYIHKKNPPSIERLREQENNSESYEVTVCRIMRGGRRYCKYCFYKRQDGKYRLKKSKIVKFFEIFVLGIVLPICIVTVVVKWNDILDHPELWVPLSIAIPLLALNYILMLGNPIIVASIYFYKYIKENISDVR